MPRKALTFLIVLFANTGEIAIITKTTRSFHRNDRIYKAFDEFVKGKELKNANKLTRGWIRLVYPQIYLK